MITTERRAGVVVVRAVGDPALVPVSAALLQAVERAQDEAGVHEVIEVRPGLIYVHHRGPSGWGTVDLVGDEATAYLNAVLEGAMPPRPLDGARRVR